jgi:hypothetical protein
MAFWKTALTDFGGFDPIYTSAGDDVDICWKALDRGYDIGFHPAALVWHHRRPGIRPYLRQQLGYGRSEALVEARHPSRFTSAGSARWRGRIYNAATPSLGRQRIYRGQFGTAAFQSGHQSAGHARELLHQLGMPIAVCLMAMLPLGLLTPALFALPIGATTFVVLLGVVDVVQATPPRRMRRDRFKFRLGVAVMHLLQPVVRSWGRVRARPIAWRDVQRPPPLPAVTRSARGVLLFEADRSRAELVASIIGHLRLAGARVQPATGWDDHDARLTVSRLMRGEMVSSGHPVGYIQVRVNRRLHRRTIGVACVVTVATCAVEPLAGVMWMAACLTDMGAGALRLRSWTRAALEVVAREA